MTWEVDSPVFMALTLVASNKQMPVTNNLNHTARKNPKWSEANQLAIYKPGRRFELGTTEQIQQAVTAELELGASELQVQHSNRSATLHLPTTY